jgi:hypothetical protein
MAYDKTFFLEDIGTKLPGCWARRELASWALSRPAALVFVPGGVVARHKGTGPGSCQAQGQAGAGLQGCKGHTHQATGPHKNRIPISVLIGIVMQKPCCCRAARLTNVAGVYWTV